MYFFYNKNKLLIMLVIIFCFIEILISNKQTHANSLFCKQLILQIEFQGILWNDSASKWTLVLKI